MRHDDRHAHQRQQDPAVENVEPTGAPVNCTMSRFITVRPMKPQTTTGDGGEQLDDDLQRLALLRAAKLGDEDGRAQPERHRHEHRQHRHAEQVPTISANMP